MTHLKNAGAALPPAQVTDAVIAHLQREAQIGGYEAAAEAAENVERTYTAIAELIGAHPDEIAVMENATHACDMAFYGITFHRGDRILTGRAEYASNGIAFLQIAERTGAVVEVIDNDDFGQVSITDLRRRLGDGHGRGRVRLVAITHVPADVRGLVNPAEESGAASREAGVPFLLDACQSVGQMPLDVQRIGCDMLTAAGRKFLRGPRGTGFLYVRRDFLDHLEPPFLDLHAATWTPPDRYRVRPDARRFENWETNYAAKIEARVTSLADSLQERLTSVHGVRVHDQGRRRCGIVTFSLDGHTAQQVHRHLSRRNVNVSVSLLDYGRFDLPSRGLPDIVRASVHYYNTEDDLQRLIRSLPANKTSQLLARNLQHMGRLPPGCADLRLRRHGELHRDA